MGEAHHRSEGAGRGRPAVGSRRSGHGLRQSSLPRGPFRHVAVDEGQDAAQCDELGLFDAGVAALLEVDREAGDHLRGIAVAAGAFDGLRKLSGSAGGRRNRGC